MKRVNERSSSLMGGWTVCILLFSVVYDLIFIGIWRILGEFQACGCE